MYSNFLIFYILVFLILFLFNRLKLFYFVYFDVSTLFNKVFLDQLKFIRKFEFHVIYNNEIT